VRKPGIRTWKGRSEAFRCPHCGAEYEITYTGLQEREKDSAICVRCHKVMIEWDDAFARSFRLKLG
jgi:hypothetical protein